MKQTPGRRRAPRHAPQARGDPHRPPMAPASPGRAHTAATLRAVKSSQVKWCSKTPGVLVFINTGGHAMRRIVPSRDIQHGPCAQGSASAGTCARGVRARAPLSSGKVFFERAVSPTTDTTRQSTGLTATQISTVLGLCSDEYLPPRGYAEGTPRRPTARGGSGTRCAHTHDSRAAPLPCHTCAVRSWRNRSRGGWAIS